MSYHNYEFSSNILISLVIIYYIIDIYWYWRGPWPIKVQSTMNMKFPVISFRLCCEWIFFVHRQLAITKFTVIAISNTQFFSLPFPPLFFKKQKLTENGIKDGLKRNKLWRIISLFSLIIAERTIPSIPILATHWYELFNYDFSVIFKPKLNLTLNNDSASLFLLTATTFSLNVYYTRHTYTFAHILTALSPNSSIIRKG